MKPFSIDLKNSDKGERKKAVAYLRGKGIEVKKREECFRPDYLTNNCDGIDLYNYFTYHSCTQGRELILTLPRDWDKLIKLVEGKKEFEKLEINKWYKSPPNVFIKHLGDNRCLGIDAKKNWREGMEIPNNEVSHYTLATHEEIKHRLTKEAEKRGFKIGTKYLSVNSISLGNKHTIKGGFDYHHKNDHLTDGHGGAAYYQGKWAEIIKDEVPETPVVNGYKLEVDGNGMYKFGCFLFDNLYPQHLLGAMETYGLEAIQKRDQLISIEDVRKVVEYIKNK
jgi:hypothetical protein